MTRLAFAAFLLATVVGGGAPTPYRIGEYWHGPPAGDRSYISSRLIWRRPLGPPGLKLPWAVTARLSSADGRRVVFGDVGAELVVVDLVRRRISEVLRPWGRPGDGCGVHPLVWTHDDRVVATLWCGWAHGTTASSLATVDLRSGHVLDVRRIGNVLRGPVRLPGGGAALLTSPPSHHRYAGFALAERAGRTRLFRVRSDGVVGVQLLSVRGGMNESRTYIRIPALVLLGGKLYVLCEGDRAAEVSPRTLAVVYHHVWLPAQPRLASKPKPHEGTTNPARVIVRTARRDHGRIVVTGYDIWTDAHGYDRRARARRVVIDVRSWPR